MKIQVIESNSKRPLANTKIPLQVRGKDSGYLSYTTDGNGNFELDSKYDGQQIAYYLQGGPQGQWIAAKDGAKLFVTLTTTGKGSTTGTTGSGSGKDKSKQTTQSYK